MSLKARSAWGQVSLHLLHYFGEASVTQSVLTFKQLKPTLTKLTAKTKGGVKLNKKILHASFRIKWSVSWPHEVDPRVARGPLGEGVYQVSQQAFGVNTFPVLSLSISRSKFPRERESLNWPSGVGFLPPHQPWPGRPGWRVQTWPGKGFPEFQDMSRKRYSPWSWKHCEPDCASSQQRETTETCDPKGLKNASTSPSDSWDTGLTDTMWRTRSWSCVPSDHSAAIVELQMIKDDSMCLKLHMFQHFLLSGQVQRIWDSTAQSKARCKETEQTCHRGSRGFLQNMLELCCHQSVFLKPRHANALKSVLMQATRKFIFTNNSLSSNV